MKATNEVAEGPTRLQIALALIVVRSKSSGVTAKGEFSRSPYSHRSGLRNQNEHAYKLRNQLKRGRTTFTDQSQNRYLDLVAYWQDRYQQLRHENDELKRTNSRLERTNEALSQHAQNSTPDSVSRSSRLGKEVASPTRQSRRLEAGLAPQSSLADTRETIEDDFDFLDGLGEDGVYLTQTLYVAHRLCKQSHPDPEELCHSLVQICSNLGRTMLAIATRYDQLSHRYRNTPESLDKDKSEFSYALAVLARAFMSVLVGLDRINSVGREKRLHCLVIYECVNMFKTGLKSIEEGARHSATGQTVSQTKRNGNHNSIKESPPARGLAHFLTTVLSFLDRNDSNHQQMFDGFVYVLLERVGKSLFYCTFGSHRSATIEGDIALISKPDTEAEVAQHKMDALVVRLEVKALTVILQRAMGLAPNHMNPQVDKIAKTPNRFSRTLSLKNLPTSSRSRLSQAAKERLQRTLVTCMFGDKVQDEFLDILTMPMPAVRTTTTNITRVSNEEVEDWFKEQVWKLVGWDILSRESGW